MAEATNPITTASNPRVGEDIFGDFDSADYKPDLASAIAAEIMGLKWTHVLPASDDIQDEMKAQDEHCDRYGELQEVVSAVLAKACTEPHTVLIASAPNPPDRVGEEVGRELEKLSAAATQGDIVAESYTDDHGGSYLMAGEIQIAAGLTEEDGAYLAALARDHRSGKLVASTGSEEKTKGADWLDQPIGGELAFDGMRFGKGVPLRTVIKAAQRWRRDAVTAFNEKVKALTNTGSDAEWTKLVTVKGGMIVDVADPAPAARDHVASARLIPWEPGSLGGVDLTFESGLRVALPLSEPEATPQQSPSPTTETDPPMSVEEARGLLDREASGGRTPWAQIKWLKMLAAQYAATTTEQHAFRDRASRIEAALAALAPSDAPSTTEAER